VTILEAVDLCVSRAGRAILDHVSVRAGSGELIAVIGPNGAGKSTLLSALAGLLEPDSGRVHLDGLELKQFRKANLAQRRSYLPQNPRCEWAIPVERLVALGLTPVLPTFGGLAAAERDAVSRALATCDLLKQRDQAATTLSGGELARAMLARALVSDPDLLIVDEPITGLDPRHALDTIQRLRALAERGKLVIAALHDLTLAGRYATRVVALHQGRIESDGAPEDILTSAMIRTLFGVEASIVSGSGGRYVDYIIPV
jgi:iron complex transport system ATP-binding protein